MSGGLGSTTATGRAQPARIGAAPRPARRRFPAPVLVGGLCGLAWAASLRGWMTQVAGADSAVHWAGTFGLVLLPGAVAGGLLGWAEHLRRRDELHGARRRWLVASPLVFAVALADPAILRALLANGEGSGALAVAVVGLCGGYALAGRGPLAARSATGLVALLLTLAGASIGPMDDRSAGGAHLAWMAVHVTTLLALLSLACSIPHRRAPGTEGADSTDSEREPS